jgi:3-oxoacyl-[acyl-carrier-protein] synthase II
MGAVSALGRDAAEIFERLVAGERGIGRIRGFDTTGCRVDIAAEAPDVPLPPRGTAAHSRTAALALHAARAALAQAHLGPESRQRVGLALGSAGDGTPVLEERLGGRGHSSRLLAYPRRASTDLVAWSLGLGGPRATLNTACSSGAVAVIHGSMLLRSGACDAVLAGGADELTRFTLTGFCSLRAVDPGPCRPFDRERRGMTLGEGAGMLLLERLADARSRGAEVLAVLAGTGHTCDAHHLTAPDPEGRSAARAMRLALAEASVGPDRLGFVNAHGTGTPHNDAAEVRAITAALGPYAARCPVHSAKASIGHCMGAAGAIEAVIAIESLRERTVPPTAGLEQPEFEHELDFVRGGARRVDAPYGLSTSFGFGGNNGVLVFARPEVLP